MRGVWKKTGAIVLAVLLLSWGVLALQRHAEPDIPTDYSEPMELEQENTELPKLIALTFDDGPRRSTTSALLDGLNERGVKATFFLIGGQIPGNEDLVRRLDQEGHQIGIHTYDHVVLAGLNEADFADQVDRTRTLLKDVLQHNDFLLRPPYGLVDDAVQRQAGCPIILWSIDPEDWNDKNVDRIVEHVVSHAQDGDIILMHDIYPTSVEAALRFIDALHEKNFLFVTVDELAAQRCISLKAGEIYRSFLP